MPGSGIADHMAILCLVRFLRINKLGIPTVEQWVKDPAWLQLWRRFLARNFHVSGGVVEGKDEKKEAKQ